MRYRLTLIIPVHNEAENLHNLKKLTRFGEVLVCDNASTDNTRELVKKYPVKYMYTPVKGIGAGIRLGIKHASNNICMFYAIDLPFGTRVIRDSLKYIRDYDMVIGSKAHKDSVNNHPLTRKLFSSAYNILIRLFFGLKIKDTQGSIMFKKDKIQLAKLTADDAFFQTQMLINSAKIIEIPVVYRAQRRGSKIHPVRDGFRMLKHIIREKLR